VLVDKKTYYMHQTLLSSSSKFFQNIMKSEWRIDPLKPIEVLGAEFANFEKYSQWLHTIQAPVEDHLSPTTRFTKLYVFAEQIMDEVYQRAMMITVVTAPSWQPSLEAIRIIYAGTAPTYLRSRPRF
jgi:hypothetical protein